MTPVTGCGPVYTQVLFLQQLLQAPVLELLELLLCASGLGDLEDVEPHSLAEGTTLAHGDDVPDLDVPAKTPHNFSGSGVAPLVLIPVPSASHPRAPEPPDPVTSVPEPPVFLDPDPVNLLCPPVAVFLSSALVPSAPAPPCPLSLSPHPRTAFSPLSQHLGTATPAQSEGSAAASGTVTSVPARDTLQTIVSSDTSSPPRRAPGRGQPHLPRHREQRHPRVPTRVPLWSPMSPLRPSHLKQGERCTDMFLWRFSKRLYLRM